MGISLKKAAIFAGLITASPAIAQRAPEVKLLSETDMSCSGTILGCIEAGMKQAKTVNRSVTLSYDIDLPSYKSTFLISAGGVVKDISPEEPDEADLEILTPFSALQP